MTSSLNAIRKLLKDTFPDVSRIYLSPMPDGFVRPSFLVQHVSAPGQHLNKKYYNTRLTWQIVYFAPLDEKHQVNVFDQLQVSEQLKKVLMDDMVLTYTEPAQKATGYIEVTGSAGTIIPAGTTVKTSTGIEFETLATATIGDESIEIDIQAMKAGVNGNVASDTVTVMDEPIAGVASITNPEPTSGGKAGKSSVYHIIETEGGPRDAEVYITVRLDVDSSRPEPEYDVMQDIDIDVKGGS